MDNSITINALNVSYGEHQVISNYSHTFPGGSVTAIMGQSGCGKTTLINSIMSLVPYTGSIAAPTSISAVFQENRLCEGLSVYQNIRITAGHSYTSSDIHNSIDLLRLGCSHSTRVCRLSGGMKRRVAILRALMADSQVLILDEPFKGLDIDTKASVMKLVKEKASARTMLIVTHDLAEAQYFNASIINL